MPRPLAGRHGSAQPPPHRRPVTLDVLIQAHPSRAASARRLAAELEGRVVYDPDPAGGANPWRCYAACLEAASGYAWTVIVQDDAEAHPDFRRVCERIVMAHPGRLVALYHGAIPQNNAIRMILARDRGLCYAEMRAGAYVPSVALIWPPHLVQRIRRWLPKRVVAADDEMISRFLTQSRTYDDRYLVTVPSLVEHPDNSPSLMGTHQRAARSAVQPPPDDLAACHWESGVLTYL